MKQKKHAILLLAALILLAVSFFWGGNAPGLQATSPTPNDTEPTAQSSTETDSPAPLVPPSDAPPTAEASTQNTVQTEATAQNTSPLESRPGGTEGQLTADQKIAAAQEIAAAQAPAQQPSSAPPTVSAPPAASGAQDVNANKGTEDTTTASTTEEGHPQPIEPQTAVITDQTASCTISIRCDTILNHMDWLAAGKAELVPTDGIILAPQSVTFYEGESVFNLLLRVCKQNGAHFEFVNTPLYHSAYIEGIHNLYEFDCGELSGWLYRVNGWFPNYGCSRYALKEGDVVELLYTCDLGVDVGAFTATGR